MIGALAAMGVLGVFSILVSEMPTLLAWPLAILAVAYGTWLLRRESRRPSLAFVWPGNDAPVTVDGVAVRDVELHWRGSLAFARWRDDTGRIRRVSWWPDTLTAASRRELRLAAPSASASRQRGAMAP